MAAEHTQCPAATTNRTQPERVYGNRTRKNRAGVPGAMGVVTEKLPLPSNEFVETGNQVAIAAATLVELTSQ
jgi:hypothetical protein